MSALFSVENRVIVITGGLGQLGLAYANCLAGEAARVALVDVAAASLLPANLAENPNIRYFAADVTRRASLETALAALEAIWGPPHGLVNNAGLDSPPASSSEENGPFETYPQESWDKVMAVNAKGPFLCCQVFGGAMAHAGRGSIVNIGSIYGTVSPDQRIYEYRRQQGGAFYKPVAYSASKSSLYNLTRYLATYWAGNGVRVNTLTLGGVFNNQDPQFLEGYLRRVPLGRMAQPQDYFGPIIFLLSDASAYVTGANLTADGGWTAW
jgi:NAD(P)-dependent dehydrogenase (short-subunit alcohol dehydrogenase family)